MIGEILTQAEAENLLRIHPIDIFKRLISRSQNDTRLNLPAATVYQKLVDAFLSDGYSVMPAAGCWNGSDFSEVLERRTSPQWDVAWKVSEQSDKTALFELVDTGYIMHIIHEIGGENVWFISLRADEYHAVKELQKRTESEPSPAPKTEESQNREVFASGAVRDTASEKPRPDLISPLAMDRLGNWLRMGAEKYEPRNWEKGIPTSRCFASLYRHLLKYQEGDTSEDHLAAMFCNLMFLLHFEESVKRGILPATLLDLPSYLPAGDCCINCKHLGPFDASFSHFQCRCLEQTKYQPLIYGEPCSWSCNFHQPKNCHAQS